MTGLERTLAFLRHEKTDNPPFHPIIMRWAAKYAGVNYRDFCTVPISKVKAMIKCAEDFDHDWVTVMSDPWAEASAFGIRVEYPEDSLPIGKDGFYPDAVSMYNLRKFDPLRNERCRNRLEELRLFRQLSGNRFIVGWVEGPVAEYVDLRGATNASVDFLIEQEAVEKAMDVIVESAKDFITLQLEAGAHCIGIGDAFCSQIGPDLYYSFAFERQKKLVDHVHANGAIAKLHICGDTSAILKGMIETGADIIDIDHMVTDMGSHSNELRQHQVFCGKSDPVTVIQNGTEQQIISSVEKDHRDTGGRCIVSAGCEITPGTTVENMRYFRNSANRLKM